MAIWSKNKLRNLKTDMSEGDRIGGVGKLFIPFALDGWRRARCLKCKKIFYTKPMTRFAYKCRIKSVKFCCECDQFKKDWKRMGTDEDNEVFYARNEAHGIKITKNEN